MTSTGEATKPPGRDVVPAGVTRGMRGTTTAAEVKARARLVAWMIAVAWALSGGLHLALASGGPDAHGGPRGPVAFGLDMDSMLVIAGISNFAGALLSMLFIGVLRWLGGSARQLSDIGLGFGVVTALLVCAAESIVPMASQMTHGFAAVVGWIMFFPLMIPAPPRRAAAAAVAAALCNPLACEVWRAVGMPTPPLERMLGWYLPPLLCGMLLVLPLTLMERLAEQAAAARRAARRLGSYRLVERLGHGGMGEVWRSEHELLARRAAVKLIRSDRLALSSEDTASTLARFHREAQLTAELQSPHTVSLFDFGASEDGELFYVMELLDGIDLSDLVRQHGPVSPARACHILEQACHSLAEAHQRGLVHRDIKPSNLMVCRYAMTWDHVKVLDFGLAKRRVAGLDGVDSELTAQGSVSGTPAFMPPEIALADEDLDGRADIYALGCVAWWLLTGQLVFSASTPMKMMFAHVQEVPDRDRLLGIDGLTEELADIIIDCLAKRPAERPAHAHLLAARLAAAAANLDDPWTPERAREAWGPGPAGKSDAGVAFAATVVG